MRKELVPACWFCLKGSETSALMYTYRSSASRPCSFEPHRSIATKGRRRFNRAPGE